VHDAVFYIALVWLAVLIAAGVLAVARARTTTGRILALDLLALLLIAILALVAGREDRAAFLDPALALALLSFVATLVAARTSGGEEPSG
jgi:multicomponent Na+:H+ antiporter subunit F